MRHVSNQLNKERTVQQVAVPYTVQQERTIISPPATSAETHMRTMAFETGWIAVMITLLPVTGALQWTADLPDGIVVHACKGGNLALPWIFTLGSVETVNIKWFYDGRSRELMAEYTSGSFSPMPAFSQRVQHLGNTGIVLSHVTTSDAGNYSVEVVAHETHDAAGKLSTFRQSAVVVVATEPPVSSDFRLHVRQESVAVYHQSAEEWRVALSCGTMTDRGQPPVDIIWMTPSGTAVSSTSYADGEFRLLLPNPVTGGTYTCHLPHDSLAATCLPKDSPMLIPAAVVVDKFEARLSLVEAEQKALRKENKRLEVENLRMNAENVAMKEHFTNVMDSMKNQLDQTKQVIHDMANQHVSFDARLANNTHVFGNAAIILPSVITNDGGAYNSTAGCFTAPYNGTYVFLATASTDDSTHYADLYLVVDGDVLSYLYADEDVRNMGSCQAVVHLRAGQQVWLASNGLGFYYSDTTTFSGFLINAD